MGLILLAVVIGVVLGLLLHSIILGMLLGTAALAFGLYRFFTSDSS